MQHLIQRGKIRSQVINVPEGFPELLSDITREVLRCQPTTECLCQFVIDYLHSVIVARDKARIAKSIIDRALRIVDEIIADMCICDIPKAKADHMCEAMEECFRRFLAQRRCEKGKQKEVVKYKDFDMLDELVQKCKFTDYELRVSKPVIEEAYQKFVNAYITAKENSDGTDSLYRYFREREKLREEERLKQDSAVKIQSAFRGYLVRKSLFLDDEPLKPIAPVEEGEPDEEVLELAAIKIQHFYRRHISLKQSEAEKIAEEQGTCSPASNVSLTARPPGHHDIQEEKLPEEKKDVESPEEVTPVKQDEPGPVEADKSAPIKPDEPDPVKPDEPDAVKQQDEPVPEAEPTTAEVTEENQKE